MLQLVQDLRNGEVSVAEVPDPSPGANEVLVRTAWSLISPGTEQAVLETASKGWIGKARDRPDDVRRVLEKVRADGLSDAVAAVRARLDDLMTPGYSSAGRVEALGPGAGSRGLRVGDRVACMGRNAAVHAELAVVPAPLCLTVPDSLSERDASFCAVGAVAAHGVRLAGVDAGFVVAVIGLGLVGQLVAQLATAAGARVVAIDVSRERMELAERLGSVASATPADAAGVVAAASRGRGADAVLIAAASDDSGPIELAAALARDRATVCVVGDVALQVPRRPFYEKELQLRVSRSYGPGRYDAEYELEGRDYPIGYVRWTQRRLVRYFLEEAAAGRVLLDELVTHEYDIADGVAAYEALADPGRIAILLRYPAREIDEPTRRVVLQGASGRVGDGLRIGLIGPGAFARSTLLPQLRALGTDVAAVAGTSSARAVGVGRRWGAAYAATSPEELIEDPAIDALVIATRHDSHADLAAQALAAGKAVFLEKPLAIDEAGLARLHPLLEQGGRLVVDFNREFAPTTRRLLEHFSGRHDPVVLSYRVNAGPVEPSHWTLDPASGGGRLVGEGCHFVDLCSAIVGSPLAALGAVGSGESFVLTLRYADSSIATITYAVGASRALSKERLEVLGSGRAAALDDFRRLDLYREGRHMRASRLAKRDKGHRSILEAALRFFRDGGDPPIPYERMLETTRATFAAREALAVGADGLVSFGPAQRAVN